MPESLQNWINSLPVPPLLTQALIVLAALALGFGFARILQHWLASTKMASRRLWSARLAELVLVVAPALFAIEPGVFDIDVKLLQMIRSRMI